MAFQDENDYIMRMIKELCRVLFSLLLGKKFVSVELEEENKYEVAGQSLSTFVEMADRGNINEAENLLLDGIDYGNRDEVLAAAYFYQHVGEMDDKFLQEHQYSREEVLDGLKQLAEDAGYGSMADYFTLS